MLKNKISAIRKGAQIIEEVVFESLHEGDTVFVGGGTCVVGEDAHYSDDASYDGYLFYDVDGNGWFPEDLESEVEQCRD